MHIHLRQCLFLVILALRVPLQAAESRMPKLFEYQSLVSAGPTAPEADVVKLDSMLVIGTRYHVPYSIERDLERYLSAAPLEAKRSRVEFVSEERSDIPLPITETRLIPTRGSDSRLDQKLDDTFFVDLPGGIELKAQFRTGVSIRLDKNTKLILRPSRKKLLSFQVDW